MNSYIVEFTRRKIERCQVGEDDRWRYQGQLHQQQKEEEKSIRKKGQRLPALANKAGGRRMLVGGARQKHASNSQAACAVAQRAQARSAPGPRASGAQAVPPGGTWAVCYGGAPRGHARSSATGR